MTTLHCRGAISLVAAALGLVGPAMLLTTGQAMEPEAAPYSLCLSPEVDSPTFAAALQDVADPQACEQWPGLTPIRPDNPALIWQDGRVLMVTWTRSCHPDFPDGLACQSVGESFNVTGWEDSYALWVTAAPEVKAFLLSASYQPGLTVQNLAERLGQYLGLLPDGGESRTFVELWVHPDDLQRPCLDPDPTDTQCDLWSAETLDQASSEFRNSVGTAYPFTGLGYTYDWGNPNTEVGASEFVIRTGATVEIAHIASTEDYVQGLIPPADTDRTPED